MSADNGEMKLGGGNHSNARSPLSLAHHHQAAAAAFDYGRAMMGSHAAVTAGLGVGSSSASVAANNTANGDVNGGLRITTPNHENGLVTGNDQQLLSPVHDHQAAAVAHQQALAAAVAAQHHQLPHQQQQQVAQQGMSENVRALFCLYFVLLLSLLYCNIHHHVLSCMHY